MVLPQNFGQALILTILTAVFWGSWANSFKGTRNYPFALFYWDYILGVLVCSLAFALTLGSFGNDGEPFFANLGSADRTALVSALIAGVIFNVANVLLIAAIDLCGLAVAFPIAIGIAVIEGVVLSYALQPKGDLLFLGTGVAMALIAVVFNASAYGRLQASRAGTGRVTPRTGVAVSIISGLLMGGFAPFVARAMTTAHSLTPYSVAALFSVGALLCCFIFNTWLMRHPIQGEPVAFAGYWKAGSRNHLLGLAGGIAWGIGTCFNFIAAGFVGVPISYAIGQSAPLIAAAWGVLVWHEFRGAPRGAWTALVLMALSYVAAIALIASAYGG
jgi:glucose uptake protein